MAFFSVLVSGATLTAAFAAAAYAGSAAQHARRQADTAEKALRASEEPFLTVEIADRNVVWDGGRICTINGDPVFFRVRSAGSAPATITGMCRHWVSSGPGIDPTPIEYEHKPNPQFKPLYIPIGNNGAIFPTFSGSQEPLKKAESYHFYGYVRYSDSEGRHSFVTGYYFTYRPTHDSHGLIMGLPDKDEKKYWYRTAVKDEEKAGKGDAPQPV